MANPELLVTGSVPDAIDPIVGPDSTVYLKAAGDSLGIPTGASDPRAPQMVQVHVGSATTPTGLALVQGTGTLAAATYYYRVSALTAAGESLACAEVGLAIGATTGVDLSWNAVTGATGYRVYGRSTGAELLIATVTAPTLTYTDSGAVTPAGALPTANTARLGMIAEPAGSQTATRTNVNDAASDTLLLAANPVRKRFAVWNDSTETLYLAYGTVAASLTSATAKLLPDGFWDDPFDYKGQVRGIWANNGSGAARITELT